MNIVITGSKGFIGKELVKYFSRNHVVIATDRNTLDPTVFESVRSFFSNNKVDVVIHAAVSGGKRGHENNIDQLYSNLAMFDNLAKFSSHYVAMFNFGSGAEFDRDLPIDRVKEPDLYTRLPKDYYGLSKNLITRKINQMSANIYNLRLFGCFGTQEEPQRLLRSSFERISNNENPVIHRDKFMDYFYVQDIGIVIEHFLENLDNDMPRDINLCYNQKLTLSDMVYKIKYLTQSSCDVIIQNKQAGNPYTGDSNALDNLNIPMIGIDAGVKECLKNWNKYLI